MSLSFLLRAAAPYLAVGIVMGVFHNAWLAILVYHLQIVAWAVLMKPKLRFRVGARELLWAAASVVTGPLIYVLLPHVTSLELSDWLLRNSITKTHLAILIPYYGIFHPFLEQVHWAPLRRAHPSSHLLFSGYHILVLASLFTAPWLMATFISLAVVSAFWLYLEKRLGGLGAPIVSHLLADLGMVIAAWFRFQ